MARKILINLTTGLEDPEKVTLAFLVATAALTQGDEVVVWTTKEAVRLGLPGHIDGVVACEGCPPLERLFSQFEEGGGKLWLCPICVTARGLDGAEKLPYVSIAGATPTLEWAGEHTTVFSY